MRSALQAWHQELRQKTRTTTKLDDLWRAASEDVNAQDCRRLAQLNAASDHQKESDRLLRLYFKLKRREQRDRDNGFERL